MTSLVKILVDHGLDTETISSIINAYSKSLIEDVSTIEKPLPVSNKPTNEEKSKATLYEVSGFSLKTIKKEAPNIQRGDILHHGDDWRNRGMHLWSGTGLVDLYDDEDEGGLSPEFTLNEFPVVDYFDALHGYYHWIRLQPDDIKKFNKKTETKPSSIDVEITSTGDKQYD